MKTVIRGARLIDGLGGGRPHGTLILDLKRIASIGEAKSGVHIHGAAEIDGLGLTVLPGLIDCHVHLALGGEPDVVRTLRQEPPSLTLLKAARFARLTLEAGFTTVRDLGFRDHSIFTLVQAIESGLTPGPRILAAGLAICMTGGHASFIGREADGPVSVTTAVREQLAAGAAVIKLIASGGVLTPGTTPEMPQLTLEELAAGIEEALRASRRVAVHSHSTEGMKNAVRAGAHSIEHATLMDEETAGMMRERGVFMVPTLSALATTADSGMLCGMPEPVAGKAKAMRARHEASFKLAHRSGIPIALGTDAGTPFNHHGENAQELERMVALGMTPMEAILSATRFAAQLLGIENTVGTLEPGKQADLLMVKGNPLNKIGLLKDRDRIMGVIQGGRIVSGPLSRQVK